MKFITTTLYAAVLVLFCLLCSFLLNQPKPKQHKANSANNAVVIEFKLQKGEKAFLSYVDNFFEGKVLWFLNTGNNDTVLTRQIHTTAPLSISYRIYSLDKDSISNATKAITLSYALLAQPGDTLRLSLIKHAFINTALCKQKNVLIDEKSEFYREENSSANAKLSVTEQWSAFYPTFTRKYNQEKERIKSLWLGKQIDSVTYQRLIIANQLSYYCRLNNWVVDKTGNCFQPALTAVQNLSAEMEAVFKSPYLFKSNDLYSAFIDYNRIRMIDEEKSFNDDAGIYRQMAVMDSSWFKPAVLSVWLSHSQMRTGKDFGATIADFKRQYPDQKYTAYLDSMEATRLEGKYLKGNYQFTTLKGAPVNWSNLIKTKKRFVVLDFWASWCAPCRGQLPYVDSIRKALKNYPVEFVSVNVDEHAVNWQSASKIEQKYLTENNYHLVNPKMLSNYLSINSIPRYVVLDNSKIVASDFYQPSDPQFAADLIKLIKERN